MIQNHNGKYDDDEDSKRLFIQLAAPIIERLAIVVTRGLSLITTPYLLLFSLALKPC